MRGIYPGRNQVSSRQGTRVEINPSFDASTSDPDVNDFPAKQTLVNPLEFVEFAERSLRILQNEEITFNKSVGSGSDDGAGVVFTMQSIEVSSNPC
jgi:hypothetical protein